MSSAPHTIDISPYGSVIDQKYRSIKAERAAATTIPATAQGGFSISKYRSELLMLAYVCTVLASPLADSNPLIGEVLALLTVTILMAGASYTVSRRILRTVFFPITTVWLLARTAEAFAYRHFVYAHLSPVAGLVLSIAVLTAILCRLASLPLLTTGVISEAFIGYLTLATAFSQVYWMLNHFLAGPFNQSIPETHISTMLYFSMITLTSVGYGGIAPINPYLRLVAALESMLGIFYIAVVVARLASSYRLSKKP